MTGRVVQWILRIVAAGAVLLVLVLMAAASAPPEPDSVITRPGSLRAPSVEDGDAFSSSTPRFSVAVDVREDGSLAVTEHIVEDFGAFSRHGIERIIPEIEHPVDGGPERLFEVTDLEVSTSPGTPGGVTLFTSDTDLTIRIGDPDTTIRGVHAYRLRYVIPAAVDSKSDGALRLHWDAISSWSETIGTLTYRITSPAPIVKAKCEAGPIGSTDPCDALPIAGDLTVAMGQQDLASDDAVTATLTWESGAFGPVAPPARPDSASDRIGGVPGLVVAAIALAILALAQLVIVRRARRDDAVTPANLDATFSVRAGDATDPTAPSTLPLVTPADLSAVGDEPVVEFVPPQRLRPAELAALLFRGSDSTRVAGTAIDLAARGYFDIAQGDAASGGADEWTLTWKGGRDPAPLRDYEQDVLETLFAGAPSVTLSDRKSSMPALASRQRGVVKRNLQSLGLLPRHTRALTGAHFLCAALTAVALFGAAVALAVLGTAGVIAWILVPVGFVVGLITVFVPVSALTPLGAAMAWRARGFKRLFDESENYHAEFAANAGLMRDYMGYAVTLGTVDNWTAAFPSEVQTQQDLMFSPLVIAAFSYSVITASTPVSTSSSSGFSGGGSFGGGGSGGGGGGGGGGSW